MASVRPTPEALSAAEAVQIIDTELRKSGIQLSAYDLLSDATRLTHSKLRGVAQVPFAKANGRRWFRASDIERLVTETLAGRSAKKLRKPAITALTFLKHETASERERFFEKLI